MKILNQIYCFKVILFTTFFCFFSLNTQANDYIQKWQQSFEVEELRWLEYYHGSAIDLEGNTYIVGKVFKNGGSSSLGYVYLTKFDRDGNVAWLVKIYNLNQRGYGHSYITTDSKGNVFIFGIKQEFPSPESGLIPAQIFKFDTNGNQLWVKNIESDEGNFTISSIEIFEDNIYVAGVFNDMSSSVDRAFLSKYKNDGSVEWLKIEGIILANKIILSGPHDHARKLRIDSLGNIYVAGWYHESSSGNNAVILSYSSLGEINWLYVHDNGWDDEIKDITIDSNNQLIATGNSDNNTAGWDIFTLKLNSAGQELWKQWYTNDGANGNDYASKVITDNQDAILVAGSSVSLSTGRDSLVIKYNENGLFDWQNRQDIIIDDDINTSGVAHDLLVDEHNNYFTSVEMYIGLNSYATNKARAHIKKIDSKGMTVWVEDLTGINMIRRLLADKFDGIFAVTSTFGERIFSEKHGGLIDTPHKISALKYQKINTTDIDEDTIRDHEDNCQFDANTDQEDMDNDGIGNSCDIDIDGDGVLNTDDAFPNDPTEQVDSDGDGVGDNSDVFPNDPAEQVDSDGDGVGDNSDAFPDDPEEQVDSDGDGVGDNSDAFSDDPTEQVDSDGDGVGDNSDAFPNDPTEQVDSDGDGVGDNSDAFPNDPAEQADSDGDGVGDNSDVFPNDPAEQADSDGDGVGDNADTTPNGDVTTTNEPKSSGGGGSLGFILYLMLISASVRCVKFLTWGHIRGNK